MITSVGISHFRCFRKLEVDQLARVNLFTGVNNVGKTALLEAVFLMLGPAIPELSVRLNPLRGLGVVQADPEEVWGWLFFDRKTDASIELRSDWSDGTTQVLTLSLAEEMAVPVSSEGGAASPPSLTTAMGQRALMLSYNDTRGRTHTSRASVQADGNVRLEAPSFGPVPPGVFLTSQARWTRDDAERFSYLEELGRHHEVVEAVQVIEPRLKRIAVAAVGKEPVLRADVGLSRLIPMAMLGSGIGRLVSIILAIRHAHGGLVLVDEVETGIHHSRMKDVWRAIAAAARSSDAQVLATTHSWECVSAAHRAFEGDEQYDFRLHRLERLEEDTRVLTYDREALGAAIRSELEVR